MNPLRAENLLLVSFDCVRPDSLGCYGAIHVSTPFIDSIASKSAVFKQAISQAPFTPASHASVFTGLNPNRHGIRCLIGQRMRPVPTLAEVFHSAGWSTAAFIGASAISREYGLDRGFNLYDEDFAQKQANWILGFRRDCTESTSKAIEWLGNRQKFFLFIHYFDAHAYDGEYVSRQTQKRGLDAIDVQMKRLVGHISSYSSAENTAIVIFSDHGDSISEHGENGHLEYLYDATIRIPLIMKLPNACTGKIVEEQSRAIDIFPTLIDYFGLQQYLPTNTACDGKSLMPLVSGSGAWQTQPAFSETYMEGGQKKGKTTTTRYFSVRMNGLKTIYEKMSRKWEGYDLGIDPAESSNIFSEIDSRFADMRRLLDKYIYEGERLEPASIPKSDESGIMRSLEALGYIEKSAQQPEGNMAFYSALNEGKKLINLGKYPEAIERITTALSVRKVDEGLKHGARMCLADACRRLKRTDEAAKYLEEVVKGCGDPILVSQAAVNLAGIYGENGEIDKAVSILDGLLSSIPQIPVKAEISVRSKRAAIYRQAEECQKAAADYEEILRKAPNEIDACYNLGSLFEHIAEYSKAQACFQQVLRMPTSNTQKYHGGAHYHLADISLKKSLGSTAEQSLRQCLTINPKHNAAKEKLSQVAEAYAKR